MSISVPTSRPVHPQRRAAISDRFLDALEELVHKHRLLALQPDQGGVEAERITAEVAAELAATRTALQRVPQLAPPQAGPA